jgi:hypothetical protein
MINNFKGKNIVQPTGGSRGGWGGKFFGMLRAAPMAEFQLKMFGAQQEKMTEEVGKRKMGEAAAKAAGNIIQQRTQSSDALEHAKNVHNTVYQQYGADHPDVAAGKVKATDFVFPGMAAYGMPENTGSMTWSSRSAAQAAETKAEIKSREQNATVAEGATKKNDNDGETNVKQPKVTPPSATPPWHRG